MTTAAMEDHQQQQQRQRQQSSKINKVNESQHQLMNQKD